MNTKNDKPKRVPPAGASNWLNHELGNAQVMVQPVGGTLCFPGGPPLEAPV